MVADMNNADIGEIESNVWKVMAISGRITVW